MSRETLAALLEERGYLETVQYGRDQRRRMFTASAIADGYGHNVVGPTSRNIGRGQSGTFPVFYPESVDQVIASLRYEDLVRRTGAMSEKRARLAWLLTEHPNLPNTEVAALTGYSVRGVEKARARRRKPESSVASYRGEMADFAGVATAA
jgi:hypothetical protein